MIQLEDNGDQRIIRINRPDKAGALTKAMLEDLADYAESAQDAKSVILTGSGQVFSAGADLEAARAGLARDPIWEKVSGAFAALPGLTIAALNGTVAGGAFGMVLACDVRIAVSRAKFFYPVMKLGFLPQPSDPGRLAGLVGPARAKMILMAGQKIDCATAQRWGLVDQIADDDELLDTARTLASDALSATQDHVVAIKRLCDGRIP